MRVAGVSLLVKVEAGGCRKTGREEAERSPGGREEDRAGCTSEPGGGAIFTNTHNTTILPGVFSFKVQFIHHFNGWKT